MDDSFCCGPRFITPGYVIVQVVTEARTAGEFNLPAWATVVVLARLYLED
jgi:hypothetical protein